jgi:hypothetical protein
MNRRRAFPMKLPFPAPEAVFPYRLVVMLCLRASRPQVLWANRPSIRLRLPIDLPADADPLSIAVEPIWPERVVTGNCAREVAPVRSAPVRSAREDSAVAKYEL